MKNRISLLIILSSAIFIFSCVGKRKIAKMNNTLSSQARDEMAMHQKLVSLDSLNDLKKRKGEMDDSVATILKNKLDNEISSSSLRADSIKKVSATIKRGMKRRDYKNAVVFNTNGKFIITEKKQDVFFVDDLLKQQNFIKFNTATFFPPGGFAIPREKLELAKRVFKPVLDSLIQFLNKYPQRKISSDIVCYGYADEQPIKNRSELWDTLTKNLNDTNATREMLNMELSRLRSEDVSGIMNSLFLQNIKRFPDSSLTEMRFIKLGKGEEYPNKTITDYSIVDERRRIVIIFWNAMPKTLFQLKQKEIEN